MKIIKGVLTYILILLGIILVAGILLFTSMAFLKFDVFGMSVIMHNDTYDHSSKLGVDSWSKGTKELYINSNDYDVVIRPWATTVKNNTHAYVTVTDNGFGLSTNGVKNAVLDVHYKTSYTNTDFVTAGDANENEVDDRAEASVIIMDLNTPQGVISYKDSKIEIVLPYTDFSYNLHINSGNGDITMIPSTDPSTNTPENGKMTIKGLYLTTDGGNVNVSGLNESSTIDNMVLKTNTGKFDFSAQNIIVKKENPIKIDSRRGDFAFKDVAGGFVIKGDNLVLTAGTINTNEEQFLYNCPNGTIKLKELNVGEKGVTFIVTEYARIEIDKVVGDTSIQATYGDTNISNTVANVVDITTTNGNITIGNARIKNYKKDDNGEDKADPNDTKNYAGTIHLQSTYGDITVNKYSGNAWITNDRGKITITQDEEASYNTKTKIEADRGAVEANNLVGKVEATATGSANMDITFHKLNSDVSGDNISEITIGSGTLNLNVPTHTDDTAVFAVKLSRNGSGKAYMNSNGSSDTSYTKDEDWTALINKGGYAKGDSSIRWEFHITVNGGEAIFNEYAKQYS